MFWIIYISASIFVSLLLAKMSIKYNREFFIVLIAVFLTPAQIIVSEMEYAPALFVYVFNILFQQELSTRVLRPLLLSIPLILISFSLYSSIKKRFF